MIIMLDIKNFVKNLDVHLILVYQNIKIFLITLKIDIIVIKIFLGIVKIKILEIIDLDVCL